MSCMVTNVLIVVIILMLVLKYSGENFLFSKYPQEQVDACNRWDGQLQTINGVTVCQLPSEIRNNSLINWQLAGKKCEIEHMMRTQGCKNPWYETNPYTVSASRGIYKWSS